VLGTRADRGGISLVMKTHMNKVLAVNEANQTAVVQPGILGPDYEAALNRAPNLFGTKRAYTCGHFPQSFELASVGGWINALGSGQASTYYGDAYDIVLSQEYVTPVGVVKTLDYPGTATGPKVNDIFKGSEGAFGVLVEATLRIFRHQPQNRRYFSFLFPDWAAAVDAAREIVQGEFGLPAVLRISDAEETERGLKLKGFDQGVLNGFFSLRGFKPMKRCLCVGIVEGEKGFARHVAAMSSQIARSNGAMSLTGFAARQWEHGRYSDIHIREDLLDYGLVLDTLETGVTWANLHRVHQGVREFVKSRPGTMCLTHASHFYPQGTNLYFILILRPNSGEEFVEFRNAVVDKIVECGGSLSHHHGVGRMFAPWLEKHLGPEQMAVLRALKAHFDRDDIMNPGGTLGLDSGVQTE
jgi:alkyldihydroxyacetonephosphate synthase